jgi:hypothetical protein
MLLSVYRYIDTTAKHTGPEILNAMVVLILVSKFKKMEIITLGTNNNKKNPVRCAPLETL